MKHKRNHARLFGLMLTGALALGALWPSMSVDASSIDIDESAFSNPTIDKKTVYVWQEGLPAYSSQNVHKPFQVLFTWNDEYYWKVSRSFARCAGNNIGNYTSMILHGWSGNKSDIRTMNGSFDESSGYPHGAYRRNVGYTGSRLSELGTKLNYDALKQSGSYLTMDLLELVPQVWPMKAGDTSKADGAPYYAMTVDIPAGGGWRGYSEHAERHTDGGFRTGRNYIFGVRYDMFDHWTTTEHFIGFIPYTVHHQSTGFNWSLHGGTDAIMQHLNFCYKNLLNIHAVEAKKAIGLTQYGNEEDMRSHFGWRAWKRTVNGRNYYSFNTNGFYLWDENGYWCDEMDDCDELYDLLHASPYIGLGHRGSDFATRGDLKNTTQFELFTGKQAKWGECDWSEIAFNCYYALPTTMNVINLGFSVENGQVSNFDVATALQNGAVITVKNGGTLSVEGLLLNNGTIRIEEGGTLYIQDGGCICRYRDGSSRGGNIDSNGLIIIGENAKLVGGGANGIKLGNGAHVVNYGLLASENFEVLNDHTVENRDRGFTKIGTGNGVIGGGFGTYSVPLDYANKSFTERGTVETACTVNYHGHDSDWQYQE